MQKLNAQEIINSRVTAMSGSGLCLEDFRNSSINPAGVAAEKKFAAGISVKRNYLLKEFETKSFDAAFPVSDLFVAAVDFSQYGYKLFNQQKLSFALAKNFGGKVNIGLSVDYSRLQLGEGYGNKNFIAVNAGFQSVISNAITLAGTIYNPVRKEISTVSKEKTNNIFSLGFMDKFSDKLKILADVKQESGSKVNLSIGMEYQCTDNFFLRSGINNNPLIPAFGFGYKKGDLMIDLSVSHQYHLGYSPGISISYKPQ